MITRTDGVTHFSEVEAAGRASDSGNGVRLNSALTGLRPSVQAVGDDTNTALDLKVSVAGVATERFIANGAAKTITDASATPLASVAHAAATMVGGFIDFLVRASDGTDHQALAGRAAYASVNKAGTLTSTITYTTAPEAKAVSTGTLTLSFTVAENPADTLEIRVQPTGSLTETLFTIEYNVQPIRGAVTIL